jgi:hypothetical protein
MVTLSKKVLASLLFLGLFLVQVNLSAQCNSCNLTGDDQIVVNQTKTYSVNALSGASYFWSVTGNLSISGSNTGASVNITAGSTTGFGQVCVTRYKAGTQPCCSCKPVRIEPGSGGGDPIGDCAPYLPNIYAINMTNGNSNTECPGGKVGLGISGPVPAAYSYVWTITPSAPISPGSTTSTYLEFTDLSQYSQYQVVLTIRCKANNQIAGTKTLTVNESNVNCDWIPPIAPQNMTMFPNPASNTLTIEFEKMPESYYDIYILSTSGEIELQEYVDKQKIEIDVSKLEGGNYFLKIFSREGYFEQKQFIKQ